MVRIECTGCKRIVLRSARELTDLCHRRSWSMQLAAVEARMRCSVCGKQAVRIGPAFAETATNRER